MMSEVHVLERTTLASDTEPVLPVLPVLDEAVEPTPVSPAVERPRRAGRLVLGLMLLGGAFVCGLGATAAYLQFVEVPAGSTAVLPPPPAPMLPPAEPAATVQIDPMVQIMSAVKPMLPGHAIAELVVRREGPVAYLEGRADSRRTVALVSEAVGRLAGVAAVDTRRVELVTRVHVLQPGETLTKLARLYYGRGTDWPRIVEANPEIDKDLLRVGLALKIPPIDR